MKYIITALFACTLAIGARAQSTGSGSSDTSGYGSDKDQSGNVDKNKTGSGSSDTGSSGGSMDTGKDTGKAAPAPSATPPSTPPSTPAPSTTTPTTPAPSGAGTSTTPDDKAAPGATTPSGTGTSTTPPKDPSTTPDPKDPPSATTTPSGTGTSTMGTASWPSNVTVITPQKGKKVEASGSLASGQKIADLSLPTSCIAAADKDKFAGNEVLFGVTLPAKNDMTITITPTDATKNVNVYAYAQPSDRFDLPGAVAAPSSCKSAVKAGWRGDQHQRTIKLTGGKETENVVIGVAGGADMTSGDFTVAVGTH